ncbi:hypothetical protein CBR_g20096 [Chara braunii]|uniref:Uncharacterized protein n=1 Tax=Chara braunii TaxID=69332 RepID=A0A388KZH3_CHABU|nr:hypothetical protein CBR_g20096 [Chara braunii]|eukprot:GBG75464.1 hypothetical protein CBR_g20096 [Chara braunii]
METVDFIRVSVSGLALRGFSSVKTMGSEGRVAAARKRLVFCEIRLGGLPSQTAEVQILDTRDGEVDKGKIGATFYLDQKAMEALCAPSSCGLQAKSVLEINVLTVDRSGGGFHCGAFERQSIGKFKFDVTQQWTEGKVHVVHSGWTPITQKRRNSFFICRNRAQQSVIEPEMHLRVKVEPDPRYVFRFAGQTNLSPQIVQTCGSRQQPFFSCKFSRDRGNRSRYRSGDVLRGSSYEAGGRGEGTENRERKDWTVMIHDLSGVPIAAATMVAPFAPSAKGDEVTRARPGAWMILRPDTCEGNSWQSWAKLEAWREKGKKAVGLRLEMMDEDRFLRFGSGGRTVPVVETVVDADKGGVFTLDTSRVARSGAGSAVSSAEGSALSSRSASMDSAANGSGRERGGSNSCSFSSARGFLMSVKVEGEKKRGESKPVVQVSTRNVVHVEDVAVFVALAAAVDLSVEACRPFKDRRRELGRRRDRENGKFIFLWRGFNIVILTDMPPSGRDTRHSYNGESARSYSICSGLPRLIQLVIALSVQAWTLERKCMPLLVTTAVPSCVSDCGIGKLMEHLCDNSSICGGLSRLIQLVIALSVQAWTLRRKCMPACDNSCAVLCVGLGDWEVEGASLRQ